MTVLIFCLTALCGLPDMAQICISPAVQAVEEAIEVRTQAYSLQVLQVRSAMGVCAGGKEHLTELMELWDQDSYQIADAILRGAKANKVDPLVMVALAWRESNFYLKAKGDKKDGKFRSHGPTQVRVDFKGRPTMEQLQNPYFAFEWSAKYIKANGLASWNGRTQAKAVQERADKLRQTLLRMAVLTGET